MYRRWMRVTSAQVKEGANTVAACASKLENERNSFAIGSEALLFCCCGFLELFVVDNVACDHVRTS